MTDILHRPLAPSADAVESAVGNETIILHLKNGTYFGLDPMGTRIWTLLKVGMDPVAICDHLAADFDTDREVVAADVRQFLGDLEANDIVVER